MNRGRPSFENRGHVKIMGITIASQSPSYKDGYKRGDTGALSIQKTFTCQAAKYQVSIVTLAVNGCAKGGLSTSSAGKNATALDYHGKTFTRLGAFVRADSSISAGIPILATAGVTASVDLMDANMVTTAQGWGTSSSDSSSIKYSGNVNSEANADVGGGTVSLWVKLLEQPVVQEVLASWSGYRLAHQELFNKDYSKVVEL